MDKNITQLEVKCDYNIKFVDSISFTLIPIKDFPKTFGLVKLAKGYFPHKFNTDENQQYVGPYPDKIYCGYDQMKKEDREKFDEWYKQQNEKHLTLKKKSIDIVKAMLIY